MQNYICLLKITLTFHLYIDLNNKFPVYLNKFPVFWNSSEGLVCEHFEI